MSTLVIGATTKEDRYANMAIKSLLKHNEQVIAFGQKEGTVDGIAIETNWNTHWQVDTITLYLSPRNQIDYYQKIIDLKPKRVIFNPGTENPELFKLLRDNNIAIEVACTLVMLATKQYELQS